MDFRGQVLKIVVENDIFSLKKGQDLEDRAAHPNKEFPGVPQGWPLYLGQVYDRLLRAVEFYTQS